MQASLPSAVKTHLDKAQATKNYGFRAGFAMSGSVLKGLHYLTNSQKHQNGQQVPTQGELKTEYVAF